MKKFMTGALISLMLLTSSLSFATQVEYKDLGKHWAKEDILFLSEQGLVNGYPDGTFKPNNKVTGEEFIVMMIKSLKIKVEPRGENHKRWSDPYIEKAKIMHILEEDDELLYYIRKEINREQTVYLLMKMLEYKERTEVEDLKHIEHLIKDYDIVNDIYKSAVKEGYITGMIEGKNDGYFRPKSDVTRAECVTLMMRLKFKEKRKKIKINITITNDEEIDESKLTEKEKVLNNLFKLYDEQLGKREVVTIEKGNGIKNDGDVDFLEIRDWWSDEEYEKTMNSNIFRYPSEGDFNRPLNSVYTRFDYDKVKDLNKYNNALMNSYGSFLVNDGEVIFKPKFGTTYGNQYIGKYYEVSEVENYNRMIYDLSKYGMQTAIENDKQCDVSGYKDGFSLSLSPKVEGGGTDIVTKEDEVSIVFTHNKENMEFNRQLFNMDFDWRVSIDRKGNKPENEEFVKQAIYRIYGTGTGEKIYDYYLKQCAFDDEKGVRGEAYERVDIDDVDLELENGKYSKFLIISSLNREGL